MTQSQFFAYFAGILFACGGALGCDEVPGDAGTTGTAGAGGGTTTTTEEDPFASGAALDVAVPAKGRVFVDLDTKALVDTASPWDLAFEGPDVFTNGGESGSGMGAAFGPLDATEFISDEIPEYPFLIEDESGGAFVRWYAYDPSMHVLYGRYHVFGVRRAGALYKVQVLGFYGDVQGAPVAAIYSLRYARVTEASIDATMTLAGVDATAGGSMGGDSDPSACVVLATGKVLSLLPAEAAASSEWDLCFRRANISVNGQLGGPGGVEGVDLDRDKTSKEKLADVMLLTAESELAHFDAVKLADLSEPQLPWTGDRIISAFSDHWTEHGVSPLAPAKLAWLVAGADGTTAFLVGFESFTGATADHPGTVRLRVKTLKKSL
jgi:hypothetical protein